MLNVERQHRVMDYLTMHVSAEVEELSRLMDVSPSTIRRDLTQLEKEGKIRRVYGGAVLTSGGIEAILSRRRSREAEFKRCIGKTAASLVHDSETIILTSGTTTEAMIPYLASKDDLAVITNAINIVRRLGRHENITVIGLGGWLRHSELSLLGDLVERSLQGLQANRIFQGAFGLDAVRGVSGAYLAEVETDRCMIAAAEELIVVADHSKFGRIGAAQLVPMEAVSMVITDREAPTDQVEAIKACGVRVVQAQ